MNKQHKHAELIKQWADGAEIEVYCKSSGRWYRSRPNWDESLKYRVKPLSDRGIEIMISKCIDYLEQNGYYGHADEYMMSVIAFKVAEQLCYRFTDKDGGEVPDDVFNVVVGLIEGEL